MLAISRMNRLLITIICFLALHHTAAAQKNRQVKSIVAAEKDHQPLADATVTLYRVPDSLPFDNTLTDAKGNFHFRRLDTGKYNIFITATGYIPFSKEFDAAQNPVVFPDTLFMTIAYKQEDTVVVRGLINPVVVKKDTLEFNPAAFRTPQDDAVEELIKKIPGFALDKDGSLTYNGEEVKEIMVDGKPFTLDPNLPITKILPVHVIDRIQLIDQKPKENKYTKVDNGERTKVLNLTIKKNKKKGIFGKASVSAGSNDLLDASANINRFKNERKFVSNLRGGNTGQSGSGQINPGRNRNFSAGAGYSDSWKKGSQFSSNGSISSNLGEQVNNSVRTTFLPNDTALIAENTSRSSNNNKGRNLNIQYSNEPGENQNYTFDAGYNNSSGSSSRSSSAVTRNNFNTPVNRYINSSTGTSRSEQFNTNFSYSRRIDTFGRSLSVRAGWQTSHNNNNQFNNTENTFFETDGSLKRKDSLNQKRESTGQSDNIQFNLNYNMPLFKKFNMNISYGLGWSNSRSGVNVYDFNKNNQVYELFNDSLSNGFSSRSVGHNISVSTGRNIRGLYFSVRLGIRQQTNHNKNFDSSFTVRQSFFNLTPGFNINYYKKDRPSIRFSYNGQTNQPSVQQRQPVIDNTNPLYLRLGNPDLRPEYSNQASLSISRSYLRSSINYSVNFNFNNTFNKITESVSYNSEGRQITRPVNLSGPYSGNMWASFGFPISKRKKHSGGINFNMRKGRTVSLLNEQRNSGSDLSAGTGLSATVGIEKWLDVTGNINYSYTETKYQSATRSNLSYNYFSASLRSVFRLPGEWEIQSQWDYTNRGSRVQYGRETTIWNAGITKKLLKKQLVASFRVQDLLKQQISYNRNTGVNYIEESNTAVIGRYYMATLTYNLNKFGGR